MSDQVVQPLVRTYISKRTATVCIAVAMAIGVIALNTKVVAVGSDSDSQTQGFSVAKYGQSVFPEIQKSVESRAIPASELAASLKVNPQQTAEKYGVGSPLPVFPVSFIGIVGEGKMGIYSITAADLPASLNIRLQTGPAITGTDLRDATGEIKFGNFTNQIEYQNAGTSINQAMKVAILEKLDTASLSGKSVKVVGVFRLLNPNNWLVTPVRIDIQ